MTQTSTTSAEPAIRLADIIREHGDDFLTRHGAHLTSVQKKALRDVADCRTLALGGHVFRCQACDHDRIAYNSCRNRHCPQCRASAPAEWLDRQAESLLPVEYFHVVFTLPSQVDRLAKLNPVTVYNALFQATAETLKQVAADPRHLGAEVGLLLVLHTWGQNLSFHPHVHGVVTGGGLACDRDGTLESPPRWKSCRPGFFLPVRVLSRVFRGKFLALIRAAFEAGKLLGFSDAADHAKWEIEVRSFDVSVRRSPGLSCRVGAGADVVASLEGVVAWFGEAVRSASEPTRTVPIGVAVFPSDVSAASSCASAHSEITSPTAPAVDLNFSPTRTRTGSHGGASNSARPRADQRSGSHSDNSPPASPGNAVSKSRRYANVFRPSRRQLCVMP